MKFIRFPLPLAQASEKNTLESRNSTTSINRGSSKIHGGACYRTVEGTIRLAYDLYNPQYPEGSTPGLATVTLTKNHSSGHGEFVPSFENFVTAEDYMKDMSDWCDPQVATLRFGFIETIICARTKDDLDASIAQVDCDGVTYVDAPDKRHSTCIEPGEPKFRAYVDFPVSYEVFLADTEAAVLDLLIDRLPFDKSKRDGIKALPDDQKRKAIEDRSEDAPWEFRIMSSEMANANLESLRDAVEHAAQPQPRF